MSGRKLDAPLAVQAASLKKTMQNREKRRHSDKAQRVVGHPRLLLLSVLLPAQVALALCRGNQRMVLLRIVLRSVVLQVAVWVEMPLGVYNWGPQPGLQITLCCLSHVCFAVPCARYY